jgi:hypothetical protein
MKVKIWIYLAVLSLVLLVRQCILDTIKFKKSTYEEPKIERRIR